MGVYVPLFNGEDKPLRQNQISYFLKRGLQVAFVVELKIETVRITAANFETIRAFLVLFDRTRIQVVVTNDSFQSMDDIEITCAYNKGLY